MIDVQTLDRLKAMRLSGMAEYFENLADTTGQNSRLTGPEMVKMAVDWEYERRRNSKLHRLRRHAALAQPDADITDIKAMPGRTVDTELIARLAVGSYLQSTRISSCKDRPAPGRPTWPAPWATRPASSTAPCSTCRPVSCSTASPSPNAPGNANAASTRSSTSNC